MLLSPIGSVPIGDRRSQEASCPVLPFRFSDQEAPASVGHDLVGLTNLLSFRASVPQNTHTTTSTRPQHVHER